MELIAIADHETLPGMPDTLGVNTDHDTRLVVKVQEGFDTVPDPFVGMLLFNTAEAGVSVNGVLNLTIITEDYALDPLTDVIIECGATLLITLPNPVTTLAGKVYYIKVNGDYTVTFSLPIDGDGDFELVLGENISIYNNLTEWGEFA